MCVSSEIGGCQAEFSIVGPWLLTFCGCGSGLPWCNLTLGCWSGYFLSSRVFFWKTQLVMVVESTFGVAMGHCFGHFCVW